MATDEEICLALTRLAMAGDGIVLGVGIGAVAIRTWLKFRSHSRALKQIEETPQVPIHDLRSLIESGSDSTESSSSSSPSSPPMKLVIVRGRVSLPPNSNGQILHAKNNDAAVLIERTQTYLYNEWRGLFGWGSEWRGLLGWGSLREQIALSRRKIPFVLFDDDAFSFVHINMDNLEHQLPLVTVYHQLHPVQSPSSTFLQAVFGRRYPVGVIDEEKILPLNKEVTCVGLLGTRDAAPSIKSCILTDFSREDLIVELGGTTHILFWSGVVLSSLAIGILSYAAYKNWSKWKAWRRERQERLRQQILEAEEEAEEEEEPVQSDVPDGQLCVVCLQRQKRAAFVACGHRVCCMGCARRVRHSQNAANARCPVCRQTVTGFIRVYD